MELLLYDNLLLMNEGVLVLVAGNYMFLFVISSFAGLLPVFFVFLCVSG